MNGQYNKRKRPYVLSIAGFDPCGGAGILADIKVFESHKVIGFGVVTCLTYQTENQFFGIQPLSLEEIEKQLDPLLNAYEIKFAKIGLVANLEMANFIFEKLKQKDKNIFIVWDPIVRSTSNFEFWKFKNTFDSLFWSCLKNVDLMTPNCEEMTLFSQGNIEEGIKHITEYCHLIIKGGHDEKNKGVDVFYYKKSDRKLKYKSKKLGKYDKHGSGCIFSASLVANLALQYSFHHAMLKTKKYMDKFFNSNSTLLGYHKI